MGERLRTCHGFEVSAFATPMKTMIEALLVELGIDYRWLFERELKEQPIPGLNVSARHLMRTLGTEWGRTHLGATWWVRCTEIALGMHGHTAATFHPVHDRIVLTDVRFPEEAAWIRSWGGVIVRIERPGQAAIPLATHSSELQPIRADRIVLNDGSLDQLHERVDLLAAALLSSN